MLKCFISKALKYFFTTILNVWFNLKQLGYFSGRVGSGWVGSDDGNSDNRANSVQLQLQAGTELGNKDLTLRTRKLK